MRRMVYFAAQRLRGSKVAEYYREFLDLQRRSPTELQALQEFRLAETLRQARECSPFYQALRGADARDLKTFPILTKDLIRDNFERFMSPQLLKEYQNGRSGWRYGWLLVKTGGSTGIPTSVIRTVEYRDRSRASRLYGLYLCGFPVGTPHFRLWGSMRDINQMRDSILQRFGQWVLNGKLLNAFQMSESDMHSYITQLNEAHIDHMMAYTDAAHELARFCRKNSLRVRPLSSLMACAGTVTEDFRSTFTEVFHSRIHNWYGSRDCGGMACECEQGGLHIFTNNVLIEIVDDQGNPLPFGQTGRILVTLLANRDFPIIRYEIGDQGSLSNARCDCGRPFPLFHSLSGRSVEFLLTNQRAYVPPEFVIHLIGVVHNPGVLRRFQLTQDSLFDYTLQFQIERGANPVTLANCLAAIDHDLKAVFGSESSIQYRQVEVIPPSASGKFLYTRRNPFPTN